MSFRRAQRDANGVLVIRPRTADAYTTRGSGFHCNELVHAWAMGGRIGDLPDGYLAVIAEIAAQTAVESMPRFIGDAWERVNRVRPDRGPRELPPGWHFTRRTSRVFTPPGMHPDESPFTWFDCDTLPGRWWTVHEVMAVSPYNVVAYTERVSLPGQPADPDAGADGYFRRLEYALAERINDL